MPEAVAKLEMQQSAAQHSAAQRSSTDLLQSLLHLFKVCLLVKVRCHDFGDESLEHIGKEKEQQTAHQPGQSPEDVPDMVVGVVLAVEAAHKKGDEQCHPHKSPQWFLHTRKTGSCALM